MQYSQAISFSMFKSIIGSTPFFICLFWFIQYALLYRNSDQAKRMFTWFLATCVVLYFCHMLYFTVGLSHPMECLWTLCSLSVYPLFFAYIYRLTSRPVDSLWLLVILLPGVVVALARLLFPGDGVTIAQKILNALQIVLVAIYGFKLLRAFDKEVADTYADVEGRDTTALKHLLAALVATSVLSVVANFIGKQYFANSDMALLIVMIAFSVMLYSICYICYTRKFTVEQLIDETGTSEDEEMAEVDGSMSNIGQRIEHLMVDEQYFLIKNLKISDVAKELGLCRTYISNYINQEHGCSFSDYINSMRIEYAKNLLQNTEGTKQIIIAESAGFSSEQSFYRNFRKFTGMTPAEWMKK